MQHRSTDTPVLRFSGLARKSCRGDSLIAPTGCRHQWRGTQSNEALETQNSVARHCLFLCILTAFTLLGLSPASGLSCDTLYLRDGSVLKGTVVKDREGSYLVYNSYGKLSVNAREVLYRASEQTTKPSVTDTYILVEGATDVVSILQKPIPDRQEGKPDFSFLLPGHVEAVYDEADRPVEFELNALPSLSRAVIRFADLSPKGTVLFLTSNQSGLIESRDEGCCVFQHNYTVDTDGTLRVLVKFPLDWIVEEVRPEPTRTYSGLIVWEKDLRRQQRFSPRVLFRLPTAEAY